MGTHWTDEQLKVINTRNRNILVSAAAGSGKTAVLVERIIAMVTDEKNPIDIDRLLVVTFTNAAASEMRERLMKSLSKALIKDRTNEHLQKQMTYIQNAKITTIDAFCLSVLKDNFGEADIDPGFRIGNKDELELLKADTIKALIDRHFEEGDEGFLEFMDSYVAKDGKTYIEGIILDLYEKSMSNVNPRQWLLDMIKDYEKVTVEKIKNSSFFNVILEEAGENIFKAYESVKMGIYEAKKAELYEYYDVFEHDEEMFLKMTEIREFDELKKAVDNISYTRLPSIKKERMIPEGIKKAVVKYRDTAKNYVKRVKEKLLDIDMEEYCNILNLSCDSVTVLTDLTLEFMEEFDKAKKEKNIVDFAQVEHLALDILIKDGKLTDTAKQISEEFYEILVDEYQDSNYLQEAILGAVSKRYKGINNIFMVGDVKQSIYGFRNARPELFVEKFDTYTENDGENTKICLSKNFRSREVVLNTCNFIFEQVMTREFCNISYDHEQKLNPGAVYEENKQCETEIIVVDRGSSNDYDEFGYTAKYGENDEKSEEEELVEDELAETTYVEAEAVVIADRIKQLIDDGLKIKDKNTGVYRSIRYSDIAVIVRSMKNPGDTIMTVLEGRNIPVESVSTTGYFGAFEIKILLAYLQVIDNARQDIPLVGVLRNVYGFSENELAEIKGEHKGSYFDALNLYEGYLTEKVRRVLEDLEDFRKMVPYTSIYQLINTILSRTGFKDYVLSMGSGGKRTANIEILLKKAVQYEKSSYSGLFDFIRYIERIRQVEIDEGEATGFENENDSVKLMTIHKSKGLEFPVVIVAGMGKEFNELDYNKAVVVGREKGIGIDYIDREKRLRYKSPIKKALTIMGRKADKAEELRVLYVALTRAKEKLILVGSCDIRRKLKRLIKYATYDKKEFKSYMIMECKSFMEIVLLTYMRNKSMREYIVNNGTDIDFESGADIAITSPVYDCGNANAKFSVVKIKDITYSTVERLYLEKEKKDSIEHFDVNRVYNEEVNNILKTRMNYEYPYKTAVGLAAKVSVSDVKHTYMTDKFEELKDNDYKDINYLPKEETDEKLKDEDMPFFLRGEEKTNEGARRGTSYHRIFELIDYSINIETAEDVRKMIDGIVKSGKISSEDAKLVNPFKILEFINSNIGKRMKNAALNGVLYREKQFVMGNDYNKVFCEVSSNEMVLIQGIIDAMFEENGQIVIVDYKTDNVPDIKKLEERYKTQLYLYADAVEFSLGKRVSEKIIYSTKFGKELVL